MNIRYRLLQFASDPYREEGRNIGLIAYVQDKAYVKALGVDADGQADPAFFRRLLNDFSKQDAWVYREWVNWWQDLVRNEGSPERINAVLDRSNMRSLFMSATDGGIIETNDNENHRQAVEWLFQRVIRAEDLYYARLRQVVVEAGVERESGYQEDFFVEFPGVAQEESPRVRIHLAFLAGREQAVGFKLVRFRDVAPEALVMAINDAVYSFGLAVQHGYLQRNRCVVLIDTPDELQREHYYNSLVGSGQIIDIFSPGASRDLSQLVKNNFPG